MTTNTKCNVTIVRSYDLCGLSRDEVVYLHALLQNPLMYLNPQDEPTREHQMRADLYTKLSEALHK
jgi:hypothetical protein